MKLLEYASKEIFSSYGIPVQKGILARDLSEVEGALEQLEFPVVIKAQVPVGGRGKAGGVKLANTKEEAIEKAKAIFSLEIKGIPVKKVLVANAEDIKREYYVGITLDRRFSKPVFITSKEGGVDIEEIARKKPQALIKKYIDRPLRGFEARELAFEVFDEPDLAMQAADIFLKLSKVYFDVDCQLAEINPLALTGDGKLKALDAKIIVDDNALYRQEDAMRLRDREYENPEEEEAKEAGLSYVKLDGYIGCMVNGAGLAMATMDVIKYWGGEPANFLDVGGSSNPEKVKKAMEIILRDKNVKSVFINIFGGITRCDDIAKGLIEAFSTMKIKVPVVVRLTGTNEDIGREMLERSGLPIKTAKTMSEGARLAVSLAKETEQP
ncbi:MAG: ADP-forming succinate--CoA ligase subunit beta [candidate division WOR-3 bacterium]